LGFTMISYFLCCLRPPFVSLWSCKHYLFPSLHTTISHISLHSLPPFSALGIKIRTLQRTSFFPLLHYVPLVSHPSVPLPTPNECLVLFFFPSCFRNEKYRHHTPFFFVATTCRTFYDEQFVCFSFVLIPSVSIQSSTLSVRREAFFSPSLNSLCVRILIDSLSFFSLLFFQTCFASSVDACPFNPAHNAQRLIIFLFFLIPSFLFLLPWLRYPIYLSYICVHVTWHKLAHVTCTCINVC